MTHTTFDEFIAEQTAKSDESGIDRDKELKEWEEQLDSILRDGRIFPAFIHRGRKGAAPLWKETIARGVAWQLSGQIPCHRDRFQQDLLGSCRDISDRSQRTSRYDRQLRNRQIRSCSSRFLRSEDQCEDMVGKGRSATGGASGSGFSVGLEDSNSASKYQVRGTPGRIFQECNNGSPEWLSASESAYPDNISSWMKSADTTWTSRRR